MTDVRNLAQAIGDATRAMGAADRGSRLQDTLEAIAHRARQAVPGFEHVGVTIVHDGEATTVASTGGLVIDMDTLQYALDEGPCMDAMRQDALVLVEDLAHQDHNWPEYAPQASEAGVRAQMGVRIHSSGEILGGLNLYSTAAETVDPEAPRRAQLFAAHAGMALAQARRAGELIPVRPVIGQAVGILMERFEISAEEAVYYLVRVATAAEREDVDVAREVVEQLNRCTWQTH